AMSLAEQSQQWYPTTVQVTVLQARNLKAKGKNGTNDAYAIIQLAKEKYSTSVVEKSPMPVWKEEATFDLPMFHQGNEQRCTLYIVVMHRALVGLDQFLGQAVINLVELQENKNRNRTEWFKLQSKEGKKEKERGEVEVDIQFKRNNMTASMFDLSAKDKPRSRIGKLKDKIRGKKKDGFSDSASAIVPSVTQVLTDSEGEGSADSPGTKKKSKLKSLFTSKSNLQRNVSQSMSTLESLPEKNSSVTSSRSSGLNIDSPEVKKKFKFLAHKRTGSNDSKSRDPLSLLGERSKRNSAEQSNLCINGRHVYTEEPEGPKASLTGSNQSLNSSGQGSVEDLRRVTERQDSGSSADSLKGFGIPSYRVESRERAPQEQQRRQEEENRLAEEKRKAEARRLSEEQSRQEELERKKQEEARKAEELKQQEEAKKSEKSSSLLNMQSIRRQDQEERVLKNEHKASPEEEKQTEKKPEQNPQQQLAQKDQDLELSSTGTKRQKKQESLISTAHTEQNVLEFRVSRLLTSNKIQSGRYSFFKLVAGKNMEGTPAANLKKPHPVKPMNSQDTQQLSSAPLERDLKLLGGREMAKTKLIERSGSGPYSQLTQEELITLVVKQQDEMSKKDSKILELEEYIDHLLVRVIEEKPSILLAMNSSKKAL
uniref:RAB11 family interacting protein 1 (class I) a n=1 Tax=Lepisosteus oculatus TaxID=7918 RepID=W5NCQ2_LEPOC